MRERDPKQITWDRRFLNLAREVSAWSKDPSTGVGCILVDADRRVVSLGFNGLPQRVPDTSFWLQDRDIKHQVILHAEQNALLFASRPVAGCTCYTWPLPPCAHCAALLIQAGITDVVAPLAVSEDLERRWGASLDLTRDLFREADVDLWGYPDA